MSPVSLHDTRTDQIRPLRPPDRIGMYVCGPTVYGRIHVGNARPYVVFLLLKRFLEHEGHQVTLVMNITDVNDKIYAAAQQGGLPSRELAREMTAEYVADTDRLGLGRPDHEPRASDAITEIIDLIVSLEQGGYAYAVDGDVYFHVRDYPNYGELSHRDIDQMDQGEGVEGAERKRDPLDFALWKAHKHGEDTAWDSPWGKGRPGWHIECSAMAEALLGVDFEIHGGGSDLIFPHHENEAAQTCAARGEPLARLWVHNGMVQMHDAVASEEEKMAKSVGNVFLLHEALDAFGPDALVMYFCQGHYRQPITFSPERLKEASAAIRRVREAARALQPGASPPELEQSHGAFFDALREDFNTPRALEHLFEWVRSANRLGAGVGDSHLREMLSVLGLGHLLEPERTSASPEARELVQAREQARAARDWEEADVLRERLRELGWEVRDGPDGPRLLPLQ